MYEKSVTKTHELSMTDRQQDQQNSGKRHISAYHAVTEMCTPWNDKEGFKNYNFG